MMRLEADGPGHRATAVAVASVEKCPRHVAEPVCETPLGRSRHGWANWAEPVGTYLQNATSTAYLEGYLEGCRLHLDPAWRIDMSAYVGSPLERACLANDAPAVRALLAGGAPLPPEALHWLCRALGPGDSPDAIYAVLERGGDCLGALADPHATLEAVRLLLSVITMKWMVHALRLSAAGFVLVTRAAARAGARTAFNWFFPLTDLSRREDGLGLLRDLVAAGDAPGLRVLLATPAGAALAASLDGTDALMAAVRAGSEEVAGALARGGASFVMCMGVLREEMFWGSVGGEGVGGVARLLRCGLRPAVEPGSWEAPVSLPRAGPDLPWGAAQGEPRCPLHFVLARAHGCLALPLRMGLPPDEALPSAFVPCDAACPLSLRELLRRHAQLLEALRGAGYEAAVYRVVYRFDQAGSESGGGGGGGGEGAAPEGGRQGCIEEGVSVLEESREAMGEAPELRWLWMTAAQEEWTLETHHRFPPRFREAVRALLLAAHRGRRSTGRQRGSGGGGGVEQGLLHALPQDVVQECVRSAAYPLSRWI